MRRPTFHVNLDTGIVRMRTRSKEGDTASKRVGRLPRVVTWPVSAALVVAGLIDGVRRG